MEHFIIDQISWHTQRQGDIESPEKVHERFRNVVCFLQNNGLTTKNLLSENGYLEDDFAISSLDLTDEGFTIMKLCYDKWLKSVDKGGQINNMKIFEKKLKTLRGV